MTDEANNKEAAVLSKLKNAATGLQAQKKGIPQKPKARPAGQIIKRGEKKYLIRIFLGRDDETGKRNWHNKTFHGTQTDAQKWLTMALRRRDMGEPIEDTERSVAATVEQAQAFLRAADEGPHGCWLAFLLATGCRPGESQALKWADVNWQTNSVTIQRNLVRLDKSVWQFGEPKTANGRRTIPLSKGMMKRLSDHKRAQGEARLKAGSNWQALDLVFCNQVGEPYAQDYLPGI